MSSPTALGRMWPAATRDEEGASNEDLILRRAVERFGRYGYGGTSTRAIASAARVTAPLIGYHFGNKEGLFHRCVEVVLGGMSRMVLEACTKEKDLRSAVECFAQAHLDFAERYPEAVRFVLSVVYGPEQGQPRVELTNDYLRVWQWAHGVLEGAIARGEFRPRPGATTVSLLRHLFHIVHLEVFASFERARFADRVPEGWEQLAAPPPDPIADVVDQFFAGAGTLQGGEA